MRAVRILILTFLLSQATLLLRGQVPGYLGNRLLGYYELNCTPFTETFFNDYYNDYKNPLFSFKHAIGVEYVLGRTIQAGAFVQFQDFNTYAPSTSVDDPEDFLPFRSKHRAAGIQFKWFRFDKHGDIAPLGRYTLLEGGYTQMKVTDDGTYLPSGKTDIATFGSWFAAIGKGRSAIHFDKLYMDFGTKIGFVFESFKPRNNNEAIGPLKRMTYQKWWGNFLLNMYLRIGLVAM